MVLLTEREVKLLQALQAREALPNWQAALSFLIREACSELAGDLDKQDAEYQAKRTAAWEARKNRRRPMPGRRRRRAAPPPPPEPELEAPPPRVAAEPPPERESETTRLELSEDGRPRES